MPKAPKIGHILVDADATGAGTTYGPLNTGEKGIQACVSGTGAVTATVVIQASIDPTLFGWFTLGTLTLSGTTTANDAFASNANWPYLRANVTAITGTGAKANVKVAEE